MGLVLAASSVCAQPADTTRALPEVVVTSARGRTPSAVSARVTVLDEEAFEATDARNVADLLDRRGGAFVRRYGPGGLATLSLRGTGASQTLVLLDGFRLTDPQLGQLDLSLLPTTLLERVEVLHGTASSWHGSDALGGVLSLTTPRPGASRGRVEVGAGAFGERTTSALVSGRHGRLSALGAFGYETAEGDFPYLNEGYFPARRVRRENADRQQHSAFGTLRYEGAQTAVQTGVWATDATRGLPGPATTTSRPPEEAERQDDETFRFWTHATHRLPRGTLRGGGFVQAGTIRYRNPQLGVDDVGRTRIASGEVEMQGVLSLRWHGGAGVAYSYGRASHPHLARDAREQHAGAFVHATGTFGQLHLSPSLRLDRYFREAGTLGAFSPRLGLGLNVTPSLSLKASVGHGFRAPTFNDRFWQPGGNPSLRPERAWTLDGGVRFGRPGLEAEATVFASSVRDEIVWLPGAGGIWSPENVRKVRAHGVEVSMDYEPPGRFWQPRFGVFATLTDTRDRSNPAAPAYGRPLRYVPRATARLYGGVAWKALVFDTGLRYTGRRYVTTDGSQWLAPHAVADVQLRLRLNAFTLSAHVENLFDTPYGVLQGYPMPGRHLSFRLRYSWGR